MNRERANPNHLDQEILLERVEKIYSDGRWNGRAEIAFWKDHYYMPFRSGSEHESSDGKIMMLRSVSREPRGWTLHNMIDTPGDDDEVHILTDSHRMVAYIPHEEENSSIGVASSTLVTQSEDGITWTDPLPAYEGGVLVLETDIPRGRALRGRRHRGGRRKGRPAEIRRRGELAEGVDNHRRRLYRDGSGLSP